MKKILIVLLTGILLGSTTTYFLKDRSIFSPKLSDDIISVAKNESTFDQYLLGAWSVNRNQQTITFYFTQSPYDFVKIQYPNENPYERGCVSYKIVNKALNENNFAPVLVIGNDEYEIDEIENHSFKATIKNWNNEKSTLTFIRQENSTVDLSGTYSYQGKKIIITEFENHLQSLGGSSVQDDSKKEREHQTCYHIQLENNSEISSLFYILGEDRLFMSNQLFSEVPLYKFEINENGDILLLSDGYHQGTISRIFNECNSNEVCPYILLKKENN